jgi:hypothetical protein
MQNYVQNLLPRLRQFSQTLDKKEILIDQPWILTGDHTNKQQFIFRRDGRLIQSVNGHVETGTWEYIEAAQSLLIQSSSVNLLLNHAFFDKGVLLLRKDGSEDAPLVLANQRIIPDLNVEKYLRNLVGSNQQLKYIQLDSGEELEFEDKYSAGLHRGTIVSLNGRAVPNGIYRSQNDKLRLEINNSTVTQLYEKNEYQTHKGIISIYEVRGDYTPVREGVKVWLADKPAPDNRYFFDDNVLLVKYIDVENGTITTVKYYRSVATIIALIVVGTLIALGIMFAVMRTIEG